MPASYEHKSHYSNIYINYTKYAQELPTSTLLYSRSSRIQQLLEILRHPLFSFRTCVVLSCVIIDLMNSIKGVSSELLNVYAKRVHITLSDSRELLNIWSFLMKEREATSRDFTIICLYN